MRRFFLRLVQLNRSRTLGKVWLSVLCAVTNAPSPLARRIADTIQPSQAIPTGRNLPSIEIAIACSAKDLDLLPASVSFSLRNVLNPVDAVKVLVPDNELEEAQKTEASAVFLGERALLPESLLGAVERTHSPGRYGWMLQQVLKLYFAFQSSAEGVLVLDADTLLTRPRRFLAADKKQLLSFSQEYFSPYEEHATRVWGARRRYKGFSFVTHHQLMQPWVVREMFPTLSDLIGWVRRASRDHKSTLSEYHSYGRWLCDNYPDFVKLARWENKSISRNSFPSLEPKSLEEHVRRRFPGYFSVSLHSYRH